MNKTTNATPKDDDVRQDQDSNFFTDDNINQAESTDLIFPIEVFPDHLQDYINQAYDRLGFHKSYSGLAILSAIGTAIGGNTVVRMKQNWNVSANLWSILVGTPTEAKTHAQKYPFKMFMNEAKILNNDYDEQLKKYNQDLAGFKKNKDKTDALKKPIKKKNIVKDITIEKLAIVLKDNPNGVVSLQDEMTGFFNKLTVYDTNNKPDYLELWSRNFIDTDRVNRESVDVFDPYVLIIGNIQNKSLIKLLRNDEDGFFERWLFALPEKKEFLPTTIHDVDLNLYKQLNGLIWKIYSNRQSKMTFLNFSEDYKIQYNDWKNKVKLDAFNTNQGTKESIIGKLTEYVLRFSLIFYKLDNLTDGKVNVSHLEKSIKLFEYFKLTAFDMLDLSDGVNPLKLIRSTKIVKALKEFPQQREFQVSEIEKKFIKTSGVSRTTMYAYLNDNKLFESTKRGCYVRKY